MPENTITDIDSESLDELCEKIANISNQQKTWTVNDWPTEQLNLISEAGIYRWFVSQEQGGLGLSEDQIARGYIKLGSACLTSTFIVTQRVAAIKRVANSDNAAIVEAALPTMIDGSHPCTVGISHLTTSRRHLKSPIMSAVKQKDGYLVNGKAPWVTGASKADQLLLGAELDDGQEILFLVPVSDKGISIEPGFDLVALSASHTGIVKCDEVSVLPQMIVAGPADSVLGGSNKKKGGGAGSVQTSALALGLAKSAIDFIATEAEKRPDLLATHDSLREQFDLICGDTFSIAAGKQENTGELRANANSLVMRSTQAAMIAAKGTGFVKGHPVGRWCSEALFFLVWSCPQTVAEANLCQLVEV